MPSRYRKSLSRRIDVVVPDGVGHRHVRVDLDVHVLPRSGVFRPGNRGEREACAFAVELLGPDHRLVQPVVSVEQQVLRGGRIDEHHHPMRVDLAVPEHPAEVDLAGHALAQGVEIGVLAVVRLVRLEAGEAQPLENARVALDLDVHDVPDARPEGGVLGHRGCRTSSRRVVASARRPWLAGRRRPRSLPTH